MKVYVRSNNRDIPHNYNFMCAYQGFYEMGFETVLFRDRTELSQSTAEDIVVGYVGDVRHRLAELGFSTPDIDYPPELEKYLGRRIWQTKMSAVNDHPESWPIFVKPLEDKQFTGVAVYSSKDLIGCGICGVDQDVYCSEIVDFTAEWRCFVRYGRILDVRQYKGDWRLHFDPKVIESAVSDYRSAPAGYTADFGLTSDGRTLLVEINDGYALGGYGLFYTDYAKLLSARWAELTGTEDQCAFDIV